MASDLTDEERMSRFVKSLERWEAKKNTPTIDITEPVEESAEGSEEVSADTETKDTSWNFDVPPTATQTKVTNNVWKYEAPAPAPAEEVKVKEEEPESLRLQREFKEKNGHDWWAPPLAKIKIKGYRPPKDKPPAKVVNPNDIDLTLESRCGEPAPRHIKFTPFAAVCKFPYKFVCDDLRQPLASAIFDSNKIYDRDWDLYYVFSDIDYLRPCLFVPESQFQALLDEINECFPDAHVRVSQQLKDEGLVIDFSEIGIPALRPRWLGHSISRAQVDSWSDKLDVTESERDTMSEARDVELFKRKMALAYEIGRNKKQAARSAKQAQTVVRSQGQAKELVRAQKYLGLLPADEENALPDLVSLSIAPVDPSKPTPNVFFKEPLFIAIDVEAWEREPKPITEVGVATLDTRDLKDVPPGKNGEGWQGAIRARHFRIAEHKHRVNKDFVEGCPEHFEFGTSEVIGMDKIASKLTSCFHAPFSSAHVVDEKTFGPNIDNQAPRVEAGEERRNLIFLGHDVDNDIAYVRKLGFDPLNRGNLLESMDTRSMYQAFTHDPQPTSLGRILYAFNFSGWHLHNAGNDAVYTVWAMLGMSVAAAAERGSPDVIQRRAEEYNNRENAAVEQAKERVKEGSEGWDVGDGGVKLGGGEGVGDGVKRANAGKTVDGFVPWQGSETGLYTENGYPLNI